MPLVCVGVYFGVSRGLPLISNEPSTYIAAQDRPPYLASGTYAYFIFGDGHGERLELTPAFANELRHLLRGESEPFSLDGMRIKATGRFEIDGKRYLYYGQVARNGRSWDAPFLDGFWSFVQQQPRKAAGVFIKEGEKVHPLPSP